MNSPNMQELFTKYSQLSMDWLEDSDSSLTRYQTLLDDRKALFSEYGVGELELFAYILSLTPGRRSGLA